MRSALTVLLVATWMIGQPATAQFGGAGVSIPRSGIKGSAGIGFTDFTIADPNADFKLDRGTYLTAKVERSFEVFHLYLTMAISHMNAEGVANYSYRNLSSSTTYTATDVALKAKMLDLSLGLKLKLIDDYWFRPYLEGGGLGGYHEITYTGKRDVLGAQGSDFKTKDIIMGTGVYAEAGLEIQFSERFGVKLAGRHSRYRTKELETLNNRKLEFSSDTFYLAALLGF